MSWIVLYEDGSIRIGPWSFCLFPWWGCTP